MLFNDQARKKLNPQTEERRVKGSGEAEWAGKGSEVGVDRRFSQCFQIQFLRCLFPLTPPTRCLSPCFFLCLFLCALSASAVKLARLPIHP